jgi:3',5'-cyclic-AMP phosphodiesterase
VRPSFRRPVDARHPLRPQARSDGPQAWRVSPFAVDDASVQLTWSALGPGPVQLRAADTTVDVDTDGGPGGIVLDGLPSSSAIDIVITGEGVPGDRLLVRTRTLDRLPGEELYRLATIGDLHVGSIAFGYRRTIVEEDRPVVPHPVRCATAAIDDLLAWGAQRLVVKGDITEAGHSFEWQAFGRLMEVPVTRGLPVDVLAGNHDRSSRRSVEPEVALPALDLGLRPVKGVETTDLPGVRLVLVDSVRTGRHHGSVAARLDDTVDAVRDASGGVLIALHHQLQPHVATEGWPPGVPKRESMEFLDAVGAAHSDTLITSGHTHRHRRWQRGPVTVTQVGSTKDFPGVWGGYVVHEGGIRQIVRRVTRPDCIAWTERTRAAALGMWSAIAPGRQSSRCFNLTWGR